MNFFFSGLHTKRAVANTFPLYDNFHGGGGGGGWGGEVNDFFFSFFSPPFGLINFFFFWEFFFHAKGVGPYIYINFFSQGCKVAFFLPLYLRTFLPIS